MGIFGGKTRTIVQSTPDTTAATQEKEEAKKKSRLLETSGENKGAQLQQNQGQSVRKIFGN